MHDNLLEILQLGELVGLFAFLGVGLFYTMWGRYDAARFYYRKIMFICAVIYLVCMFILRVLNF